MRQEKILRKVYRFGRIYRFGRNSLARHFRYFTNFIELLMNAKALCENTILESAEILEFHHFYDEILENGEQEFLRNEKPNKYADDVRL